MTIILDSSDEKEEEVEEVEVNPAALRSRFISHL